MKVYEIEQYEIWTQKYRVKANSEAEAINKLYDGKAKAMDNELEFIEVLDNCGMPEDENRELVGELAKFNINCRDIIPSVRRIECIEDDE